MPHACTESLREPSTRITPGWMAGESSVRPATGQEARLPCSGTFHEASTGWCRQLRSLFRQAAHAARERTVASVFADWNM